MLANHRRAGRAVLVLFTGLFIVAGVPDLARAAATIVIQNGNAAGVGFNDLTPATPIGGNPGTTLGQQRLNAFQAAADKWGASLTSVPTITVLATMEALSCTATSAVLGAAGAHTIWRDGAGAVPNRWYGAALANKLFGADILPPPDPDAYEIQARFNSNLGNTGCLDGIHFYLGLDGNHGTDVDLVTVLEHEFAHGLGFQTFTNGSSGAQINDGSGAKPSIWDDFLLDTTTGKLWSNMTNAERAASALKSGKLVWTGANVAAQVPVVLQLGTPQLTVTAPSTVTGAYLVGAAAFGAALNSPGVTGSVEIATDAANASGPSITDACTAITNASAVSGKIALVDRGTCGFAVKVKNAQNAGAVAVLVADNVAGSPPPGLGGADPTITIPSARITLADGNAFKAAVATRSRLRGGMVATLGVNLLVRAGADGADRALLYAPNPYQAGSSVSHWDTSAFPNQLMEPAINGDLTHEVMPPQDLTLPLLKDIGW